MALNPITARITREFRRASAEHLQDGRAWYPAALEYAEQLSAEYGVSVSAVAGTVAALSPITEWNDNKRRARRAIEDYLELGEVARGHTGAALANVNMILSGEDPDTVLRGPKTNAFFHAILSGGERGTAVVDRHAWNMLVGTVGANAPTPAQYRTGAELFARAARILGESVHTVQAVTWVSWRTRNAWATVTN